jgi:uncharacterized protein YndB with AHSA1/START domain
MHVSYEKAAERPTLRFERALDHSVEAVWRAITEASELAHWFPSKVQGELRVGGALRFEFEHMPLDEPTTMTGRVTELDPQRLFAFYWGEDHLRFALEPLNEGRGCLLRLTVALDAENKAARDAAGWHQCLEALAGTLDDAGPVRPMAGDAWQERYDEYSRRGFPIGAPVPDR